MIRADIEMRARRDFDVEAIKASVDIAAVIGSYVALKRIGSEYRGLCPFHAEENPSFYVIPQKGFCHCFSCGASHDVIGFIQEIERLDFQKACEHLGAARDWTPKPITDICGPKLPERVTSVPPDDAGMPSMTIRGLGEPVATWMYRTAVGKPWGYVARYDTPEGKQIRCWTWGARGQTEPPSWGCGHWTRGERPLYNLDKLAKSASGPSVPVLVVEGEKAADAAQKLIPGYVVTTWPGGSNAWKHADLSPLAGRRVDLWPDNDEPGTKCMGQIADMLKHALKCTDKMIDPAGKPEGFDAADWTGSADELMAWLRQRAKWYAGDPTAPTTTTAAAPARRPTLAVIEGNTVRQAEPEPQPADGAQPASLSHDALADAFVSTYGQDWRYVGPWGKWYQWDGERWRRDDAEQTVGLAKQITRHALYWPEAAGLSFNAKRDLNSIGTAKALLGFARPSLAATVDQWDADYLSIGVPGGVIDLRTGATAGASRDRYITKRTAVAPAAGRPELWLKYLHRAHDGNQGVIDYLQRFAGYCTTGETKEHALAFLYGTGRNGKGVFLETVRGILGDYAQTSRIETFMEQKYADHPTELARLQGARLVVTEEAGTGCRWNEGRIKHITGGGRITARLMRQDDFEFTPQFKLLIAANHKPALRTVDEAIKARIHLVPFRVTIPPEERDKDLLAKLQAEWPQIFAWMLDGCAEWQRTGLQVPQAITEATDQYVQAEDIFGAWLEECCERSGRMASADGYRSYATWCEKQGERPESHRAWSNTMVERGFDPMKSHGVRMFIGGRIKTPAYEPQPE